MKIAIVHDDLAHNGGAEKVLQSFMNIWPQAPVFTLVHDKKIADPFFLKKNITTSFLQHIPFARSKFQWFLPFLPTAIEQFNLRGFDIVLSSASSFGKGVIVPPGTVHICYCYTPSRFLWHDRENYIQSLHVPGFFKKIISTYLTHLQAWDLRAARRVTDFISISSAVRERIRTYYQRDSTIIHPPVDFDLFSNFPKNPHAYFLAGGRLVPHKRFDLVIDAFNELQLPLIIFGDGPEYHRLKKRAHKNINFTGRVSIDEQRSLFAQAQAFINPQVEDFGITMLESMASGTPLIAYRAGGALDILTEGVTGVFFNEQTAASLVAAIRSFNADQYDEATIRAHTLPFSRVHFEQKIKKYVEGKYQAMMK